MGGCTVELDCARRAHLGPETLAYEGFSPPEGGTKARTAYSALCSAFGRRLVPDILSGASAGGVNGALLAAAMCAGRRLHPEFVRRRWVQLGDFARLLHPATEEEPRALMQGQLFHDDLLAAFEVVLGADPDDPDAQSSALPEGHSGLETTPPRLDVTATDVAGEQKLFTDNWGGELVAREHRARFRFREEDDFEAANLAAAARSSASFPVAFEPWQVEGDAMRLAGLDRPSAYTVDGGLLDNAPIRAALEQIPLRRAGGRVRRYVCYLNADPTQPEPAGTAAAESPPELSEVLGYAVNLPRLAPFVDQLYAVEEATRRSRVTPLIQVPLLRLDLATLRGTAGALLPAYRRRRALLSLGELIEEPAAADAAASRLRELEGALAWIPLDLEPPGDSAGWDWGVRPAQRVLYLILDLIRPALEGGAEAAPALQRLRADVGRRIEELEAVHTRMGRNEAIAGTLRELASGGDQGPVLFALLSLAGPYNAEAFDHVAAAIEGLDGLAEEGLPEELSSLLAALFGPAEIEAGREWSRPQRFLARALAIEVVRRALAEEDPIDSAEPLHFVQLTPSAPTPILGAEPRREETVPSDPGEKLTGIGLGHFAAFYRRSWRVNDFMWGRLDAAARIVEMLVDEARAPAGTAARAETAASLAAAVLPPNATEAARWLVHEALEAQWERYELGGECVPDAGALRGALERAIASELGPDGGTPITRTVFTRAAQLEILQDELPVLARESAHDAELGSSTARLELPLEDGMRATIEALRSRKRAGRPLPVELNEPGEEVSDLGMRTISHTALVGLSAARTGGIPLAKLFGVARAPLLAVSGAVSRQPLSRATAAFAFWAAALYLTMGFATARGEEPTALSDIWSAPILLSVVAALAVLGVVLIPGLRLLRRVRPGESLLWTTGLAGAGGLGAALLAIYGPAGLDPTSVLFATGSERLPSWLLTTALAVTAGLAAVRLPVFGSTLTAWLTTLRDGWRLCGPLIAVSAAVAAASAWRLWPLLGDSLWETVAASLALFAAPALVAAYLLVPLALAAWRVLRRQVAAVRQAGFVSLR